MNDSAAFEEFFIVPGQSNTASELYKSYVKCNAQYETLPSALKQSGELGKLNFFYEVHSREVNGTLYRKRMDSSEALVNYWLARVREVASLFVSFNGLPKFQGITKEDLKHIAHKSQDINELPLIESYLAGLGVILVTERSVPSLKLDGAVFRLDSGHPVVALSLRYNRLDNFWFTLMHELAHLYLHLDELNIPIIEDLDESSESLIEMQADRLALNTLIPSNKWRNCPPKYNLSDKSVVDFAAEVGIHPAIVAGRLRKELNQYNLFKSIIHDTDVRSILGL